MQRVIKFRVWDKKAKMMFQPDDEHFTMPKWYDGTFHGYVTTKKKGEVRQAILMQYTGLKDKNGEEIYESDIVKYICANKPYIGEVFYFPPTFVVTDKDKLHAKHYPTSMLRAYQFEIIGNKFENPELLEQKCLEK